MASSDFVETVKYFQITPKRGGYQQNTIVGIEVSPGTANPPTIEKGLLVKVTFKVPKVAFDALDVVIEVAAPNTQAIVDELKDIAEATR